MRILATVYRPSIEILWFVVLAPSFTPEVFTNQVGGALQ